MPVSATTLRKLMDAGLSGDDLIDVVASIDADHTAPAKVRTAHAERQERYRQRQAASQNVTSDASGDATPSPKESPHTPKETPPSQPTTPKENPLRGQKKAVRLPADFAPDLAWAVGQGLSPSQAETEAAKFRDYWTAKGRDAAKLDWAATWRNWIRNSHQTRPMARGSPPAKPAGVQDVLRTLREKGEAENGRNFDQGGGPAGATVLSIPNYRTG